MNQQQHQHQHKNMVIKELDSIENEKFFIFLYNLIKSFRKEWGI